MSLPQPVRLYGQRRAPNPRRVDIFLAEKGVEIPRIELNLLGLEQRRPDYVARTGIAQVPALELSDGAVLTETQAICRYLEALHPEPNMIGRDVMDQVTIEMWQRRMEFGLFTAVGSCFRHTNPHMAVMEDQCPDWGEVNRRRIGEHLQALDARLEGRDWIAADRLTVADITAIVAIDFLRVIKYEVPDGLRNLAAWAGRMHARPSTALPARA